MRISDDGIILFSKKLQEKLLLVKIFSKGNGLCSGIIRNVGQKKSSDYQVGTIVKFQRYSRLCDQLGTISCEPIRSPQWSIMTDKFKLSAFNSMCILILNSFVEFESHIVSYNAVESFIDNLASKKFSWLDYCLFELELLKDSGYGLELEICAVTNKPENLLYVSPKTGRAVSKEAAAGYEDRLLKLPNFLIKKTEPKIYEELEQAFDLYEYFFERYVLKHKFNKDVLHARNFLKTLSKSVDLPNKSF